ncbi:dihydrodipicolinate synthase family protein [Blastopirellula sp. J2-11]|uniref:dihydrodipicolinate synthase family protein n=1 Tax=Blastopirellula sp. J2-11 TaxID=2943192 RepID=UPI0021C597F8|nr:dihydrodipicolinate synthase family protein [Blastopirellula sp. J2-11]UUO06354.1 dihydrodipicolinate synthase family protein [Blastopirellula sp. J2-11]
MYENITGIVPPMVTPFRADGSIDEEALRAETRYLIDTAQVHGLAVCGSTGEGQTLSVEETRLITAVVCEEAAGSVPVITGIIADSTAAVIERGLAVRDLNVAALQVTPVHYVFRPDDDAMTKYFADITAETELPLIIYNVVPWAYLSPQLLTRIIDSVDGVIGVKQSAGDLKLLADLLMMVGDRARIMSAVDALLYPSYALGAVGAIAATLTAVPGLCVEQWNAVQAGDHQRGKELHEKILPIWNAIFDHNLPANIRYCMELQGRGGGVPRPPMPATSAVQKEPIREALIGAGVVLTNDELCAAR